MTDTIEQIENVLKGGCQHCGSMPPALNASITHSDFCVVTLHARIKAVEDAIATIRSDCYTTKTRHDQFLDKLAGAVASSRW